MERSALHTGAKMLMPNDKNNFSLTDYSDKRFPNCSKQVEHDDMTAS